MKKILIFGGAGMVGSKFISQYFKKFEIKSPTAQQLDILNKEQLEKEIAEFKPEVIINFAAYTNVEEAEKQKGDEEGICFKVNSLGVKNLAELSKKFNIHLVQISTEYVFEGTKQLAPYVEQDTPNPINWYGKTKLMGEQFATEAGCDLTIVRLSMPFTSHFELKKDVARFFLEQLKAGQTIKAVEDQRITPTLVNDIADALVLLVEKKALGVYHVSSRDSVSPLEFAKTIAQSFNLNYSLISGMSLDEFNQKKMAKLLRYSWLNPTKFIEEFGEDKLHTVEEGLVIFKQEIDQSK